MAAVLAELALEGPAKILQEAFERVLDVDDEEEEEDIGVTAAAKSDNRHVARRVFVYVIWVYDHVRRKMCSDSFLWLGPPDGKRKRRQPD